MKAFRTGVLVFFAAALISVAPRAAFGQAFVLDPMSASLPVIPATSGDLLAPSGLGIPSGPPPVLGVTAAAFGLLPGDVIDAISGPDDAPPGSTLTFSVARPSIGVAAGFAPPPDVASEVAAVLPGIQPEAASDLFTALDPACPAFPPDNVQIVDGDGAPLVPPGCYGGFPMGLTEGLPLPGPPFNDDVSAFDWGLPARHAVTGFAFSLAAGSPSLTPGTNPLLPAGAEPGDILVSVAPPPPFPPVIFPLLGAAGLGLVSGGPGCAPPACDDVDAFSYSFGLVMFSITPGSPSIAGCPYSAADVLGGGAPPFPACAPPFLPAGAIGLLPADDVNALASYANGCPIAPIADFPLDGDGIDGGVCDICPFVFDPGQKDSDFDAIGDSCDPCTDTDGDVFGNPGFPNFCPVDLCPSVPGPNIDTDGDGPADECDNCPLVPNPSQTDGDFDGSGDACDPCPHVSGAIPVAMTVKKVMFIYGGTGPGGGDDKPKAIKAEFTAAAFDPDSTENVHVTFTDADTVPLVFGASLPAGPPWTQLGTANKWKYLDTAAANGVKLMLIKEDPSTPGDYTAKVIGKNASITSGPLVGGAVTTTIEIESGFVGQCFAGTNAVCTSTATKDKCL
jgi:hypothetical protein